MITAFQITITLITVAVLSIATLAVIYVPKISNREKAVPVQHLPDKSYHLKTEESRAQIRRGGMF